MKKHTRDKIVGGITLTIIIGIPLGFILGPVAFGAFIGAVIGGFSKHKQTSSIAKDKKRRADELITTVLPTIDPKN